MKIRGSECDGKQGSYLNLTRAPQNPEELPILTLEGKCLDVTVQTLDSVSVLPLFRKYSLRVLDVVEAGDLRGRGCGLHGGGAGTAGLRPEAAVPRRDAGELQEPALCGESALEARAHIPVGERGEAFDDGDGNPERWVFRRYNRNPNPNVLGVISNYIKPSTSGGATGTKNQHNMESIQEVGLSCLSPRELSSWQTQQQDAGTLTRCRDCVKNWQGNISQLPTQGDSPCQVWAGIPIQISEDENYILSHIEDSSNYIKNQEFPSWRAQHSWRKMYLTESCNYQCGCRQVSMKNDFCKCDSVSWISHHNDSLGAHRTEKNSSCHDCGEDIMKVSLLSQDLIQTGQKPYPCIEYRKAFSDDSSSEVHQQLQLGGKPHIYSPCGKGCSYDSVLHIHQSVHRGNDC
ncbi:hypothetical protein HPG69_009205, partial [Diceros bicornis minor]